MCLYQRHEGLTFCVCSGRIEGVTVCVCSSGIEGVICVFVVVAW